ncbi:MAG: hypothetical protein K1X67_09945 [Fimbriimonadaceae bacterium]|nr:hypothetical protein [Fimbriimonadaceae bacterium]
MRLKILTSTLFVAGILMLLAWPLVMADRPNPDAERKVLAAFGLKMLIYFGATAITFLATAICALLLVRRAKLEFRDQASENLRGLIEGTLRDHGRKSE